MISLMPITENELAALRAQTPACSEVLHFNHSGASLPSQATIGAITAQLGSESRFGPMESAATGIEAIELARSSAASLLNAHTDEIAFASSGSAAWGSAFAALGPWRPGDRILLGRQEWAGNLATMHASAGVAGASIEVIPCASDGSVSVEALAEMIDDRVRLISLTWLPANGGLINPAAAIGAIARAHGIPYFVDAGQALGQMRVDVRALGCDVLKGAGRKFLRAPRGTAVLYVRRESLPGLMPPYVDVLSSPFHQFDFKTRNDARRFESSEVSMALMCGLSNALQEAVALGVDRVEQRVRSLSNDFRNTLMRVPGVTVRDLGTMHSGLVSFTIDRWSPTDVKAMLARRRINVGVNGIEYTPLDMHARCLSSVVRVSISHLNTVNELDELAEAIAGLISN
jgi:selenocysteine lyase/cysteine desulfurase